MATPNPNAFVRDNLNKHRLLQAQNPEEPREPRCSRNGLKLHEVAVEPSADETGSDEEESSTSPLGEETLAPALDCSCSCKTLIEAGILVNIAEQKQN